jgi:NTE family protein
MRAFVLSGGGNRGPLEVGAIRTLLEHGIQPEMIVGSSAGALNGALLAVDPSLEQVKRLVEVWRESGSRRLIRSNALLSLIRLARGSSALIDNRRMAEFVRQSLPADKQHFGDLPIPLYVTITHLLTHTLYVYGDDPAASIATAVVTSAAVPGFFPPSVHQGEVFVDGGVVSNLPVLLAIARGATEIWAIDLANSMDLPPKLDGALAIIGRSVSPVLYNDVLHELEIAMRMPGIILHHVPIYAYQNVALGDFSHTEAMLVEGARVMGEYLKTPEPNVIHGPRRYCENELPPGPPGSRPFVP